MFPIILGIAVITLPTLVWATPVLGNSINNTGSIAGMYQALWDGIRKTCSNSLFWVFQALGAWMIVIGFVLGA